ncbi:Hypothetical predicted protein [Mytilus galloprovincialis]|uniref:Reverse transcriptase domain-containing protein n=1 Tax=Mytilus galloprovincialis TaxID=29158 RepID=A0A8B6DCT3_MYTGA|nr:Hypothetical predicted protein [Mytilus galloprovincialis]
MQNAFTTRYGLFEYTRMPFGLCGAPGTFQRVMELVLRGLQWEMVLIYLDDVIIASPDFESHISHLTHVFERFSDHGLKLKPIKCKLFEKRVLFLGHYFSARGIETNSGLTDTVKDWPVPSNVKELQTFLGLINYYQRFISKYAGYCGSLVPSTTQRIIELEKTTATLTHCLDILESCFVTATKQEWNPLTLPCNGCQHCSKLHTQWEKFEADVDDVLPIATRRITAIDNTDSHRTWIEGYSRMQLQEEQLKDSVTKNLMEWMKH